jgi:molybdopterin converting factor small subunit
VIIYIPAALRGRSSVVIEHGPTMLNDVLAQLWQAYPGLRDRIITEQGQVRQHINIFVGEENIRYLGGLATRVPADGEISIIPAVSGGVAQPDCELVCSASNRLQVR